MKEKLKYPVLILIAAVTICLCSVLLSGCGNSSALEPSETLTTTLAAETTTEAPKIYNPLTGLPGYSADLLNSRPVMIMVNNHSSCRPQWGLTTPDIIFETVTEGGITRMLWMYSDVSRIPEKVGSVRSARHYYIQLAQGYDAIFVHWGGSTYAYEAIDSGVIDDIDGMTDGAYFARDTSRGVSLEHTGYTTGSKITQAIADMGFRTEIKSDYKSPFSFNEQALTLSSGTCQTLSLSFSTDFSYTYRYNATDSLYYSYLNDTAFVDSDGVQQSFTNVIVIYAPMSSLNDSKGRITLDFTGGKGIYVSDGTYENITWKKGSDTSLLRFYAADGSELKLNPGRSYIGIVPTGRESYTSAT